MISWIVTTHDESILNRHLAPSLFGYCEQIGDEVIILRDQESITQAYAQGQRLAAHKVKCYIHHDVKILDAARLRKTLIDATVGHGIVGLIGSQTMILPWWHGALLGSVRDGRTGVFNFGAGGECAVVDGLLLATRLTVNWDESWPGWHGYEYDACQQMITRGIPNWCVSNGHQLVSHNSDSPYGLDQVDGWTEAVSFYQAKWSS